MKCVVFPALITAEPPVLHLESNKRIMIFRTDRVDGSGHELWRDSLGEHLDPHVALVLAEIVGY